jgi:hypothetical protein
MEWSNGKVGLEAMRPAMSAGAAAYLLAWMTWQAFWLQFREAAPDARRLLHGDFRAFSDFDADIRVANLGHLADDAAVRDHFVALRHGGEHVAVFFLALHLRANHDEVQHAEHQDQRQEAHQARFCTT